MPRKTNEERLKAVETEIENKQKEKKKIQARIRSQQDKERTHRLCERMGMLEEMLPDTIKLTKDQFRTFLKNAVANEQGRQVLRELLPPNKPNDTTSPDKPAPQNKSDVVKVTDNPNDNKSHGNSNHTKPPHKPHAVKVTDNPNANKSHGGSVPTKG